MGVDPESGGEVSATGIAAHKIKIAVTLLTLAVGGGVAAGIYYSNKASIAGALTGAASDEYIYYNTSDPNATLTGLYNSTFNATAFGYTETLNAVIAGPIATVAKPCTVKPENPFGANCPPTYTSNGLTCGRNDHTYSAPSKVADCPEGFTNTGLTCFRPDHTYRAPSHLASCGCGGSNAGLSCYYGHGWGKCTTVFKKYYCCAGYTDIGCGCSGSLTSAGSCPSGYFMGFANRCYVKCPEGYTNTGEFCQRYAYTLPGGTKHMTCPKGYFLNPTWGRCYVECPTEYTNTGEFCQRYVSTLGLSAFSCPEGYFLNRAIATCYGNCPPEYTSWGFRCVRDSDPGCWGEGIAKVAEDVGKEIEKAFCNGAVQTVLSAVISFLLQSAVCAVTQGSFPACPGIGAEALKTLVKQAQSKVDKLIALVSKVAISSIRAFFAAMTGCSFALMSNLIVQGLEKLGIRGAENFAPFCKGFLYSVGGLLAQAIMELILNPLAPLTGLWGPVVGAMLKCICGECPLTCDADYSICKDPDFETVTGGAFKNVRRRSLLFSEQLAQHGRILGEPGRALSALDDPNHPDFQWFDV